jgi:hypothetical protein
MTDLSPAQKAVAAFNERHELCGPFDDDWVELCLAAALGKVTDEVMSPVPPPCDDSDEYAEGFLAAHIKYRYELLAIAAELRGTTTPTETP